MEEASRGVPESLILLWEKWELQVLVLLSLFLQIVLIGLGNQRKYKAGNKISVILWLAYLSADSFATIALGILSRSKSSCTDKSLDPNYVIMAFWAPFLLLHLGGPDTITAYSLEDNELWLRHLLGLMVQAGVAFYVFFRSLKPTQVNFVAIPIFVAGLIKYGERTWALRSASSQHFKSSLLPRPDPGPNYAKFMEEYTLREMEGYKLSLKGIPPLTVMPLTYAAGRNNLMEDADAINIAYDFFLTYKRLFADLILSFQDLQKSRSFFSDSTWDTAFKVIEIELGFTYDVLFTKAKVIHSFSGGILRITSLTFTLAALMAFCFIDWNAYSLVNVGISLFLLGGAIGLEVCAIFLLVSSDWTALWLSKHNSRAVNLLCKIVSYVNRVTSKKRWSNCIAQHNLISYCLKDEPTRCWGCLDISWMYKFVEKYGNDPTEPVSDKLKKHIFEHLLEKSRSASNYKDRKYLCSRRGDRVLGRNNCLDKIGWSTDVEFDQSIILWHIATDLCYYHDVERNKLPMFDSGCEVSRSISNYMVYILVKCPFMLPDGIGQIRLQDTCAEAIEFVQERSILSENPACLTLLLVDTKIPPDEVKGDRSKSVLFDACRLANLLQSLEKEKKWKTTEKWKVIGDVWMEMLSYAAGQCRWNHHAQQLRRGGELLTHVWLLMAHLGITEHFQISQGHARAKLNMQ